MCSESSNVHVQPLKKAMDVDVCLNISLVPYIVCANRKIIGNIAEMNRHA